MRHNIRFNILGLFAAAAALLTVACQRDPLDEAVYDDSDYVDVTFSIQPEGLSTATRTATDKEPGVDYTGSHISDGTKADILIYAVYDENGKLLPEFGQVERGGETCTLPDGTALGEGQTCEDVTTFPHSITLNVRRGKTYKIAFWAQNSKCKAYDVHDLKKVEVIYAEIESAADEMDPNASTTPNNDEMRDAFCWVETVKIENKSVNNRKIYLYRPLAQINVGTTGYDYEAIVQDEKMNYAYTRIQIISAPRYLDVVNDEILTANKDDNSKDKDNVSGLEYGWALIPAYANAEWAKEHPADPEGWSSEDNEMFEKIDGSSIPSKNLQKTYEWEEFLKVKIYPDGTTTGEDYMESDGKYLKYAGLADNNKKTETFKYLSMCYVLAPSNWDAEKEAYERKTFDRVRVWIATDKNGANSKEIIDISSVPVTRNWRTNIVGNILTTDVPFEVKLDPIYAGDYNGFYDYGDASWSGPLSLDKTVGAYYDAEKDEILISNVGGLLWFQQMVNGDLLYRDSATRTVGDDVVKKKTPIKYYDEDKTPHEFGENSTQPYFKGIPDPTTAKGLVEGTPEYEEAEMLKERILIATHQKWNNGYDEKTKSWPEFSNFHFVGEKDGKIYPANVKLAADIDLSGIEWLGIGFDCKMEQTMEMLGDNDKDNKATNEPTQVDKSTHRGFFGHFDGDGHTVSNLKTKRFSINVHPASYQLSSGGPYDAVQWFARGFFGQLGGTALVENLKLYNVDIYGFHCVGGIAGAAIGLTGKGETGSKGAELNIRNCVVSGGKIENVPMYRGDAIKQGNEQNRTYARGVNTGGIVGLYNASGSVTGCEVLNLTISGYRITGGIVGCIANYYFAYTTANYYQTSTRYSGADKVKMKSIKDNKISGTTIIADHFKPFNVMRMGPYDDNGSLTKWSYGFSWLPEYDSFVYELVGGENGGNSYNDKMAVYVEEVSGNTFDDSCQIIDLACDYPEPARDLPLGLKLGRLVKLDNVPVDALPVMNNWFVDFVDVQSNLVGDAAAYKRYTTYEANMFSYTEKDKNRTVMWDLPYSYTIDWDEDSGAVGMRVGAVQLNGEYTDKTDGLKKIAVLSVRKVTGKSDCAMQISSCNRKVFTEDNNNVKDNMPDGWDESAETQIKNLAVRGNPYAYTGICLSPNECMKAISLENVAVYDCYQTLALDNLPSATGKIWPRDVDPSGVTLEVKKSNLRGYTVPGARWQSIDYDTVVFEMGAFINSPEVDSATRNLCDVEAPTTFTKCTFKAPFTINIKDGGTATFTDCEIDGPKSDEPKIDSATTVPTGTKKIEIDAGGEVTYYDGSGSVLVK